MELRGTMQVNSSGHLVIGGCDTTELAAQFGTPLYVIDEVLVRQMAQRYQQSLKQHYPSSAVAYAGKASLTMAMCKIVESEGLSLDVVSGGELYTAVQAGFPMERVFFHGNNKSRSELELALTHGVGRIVVDNYYELEFLQQLADEWGQDVDILLRITPGVEAHTHTYIQTGQIDSKFGFGLADGAALTAVRRALAAPRLNLRGVHCHIGSQIFDITSFGLAVRMMMEFIKRVSQEVGWQLEELDLGGGLGIRYNNEDSPVGPEQLAKLLAEAVHQAAKELDVHLPALIVEPGRSIVGEAGTTLYTVGSSKDIPNIRRYVAVDGGMGDNPRVALYQAKYEAAVANRMQDQGRRKVSIAGKCCESGDMLLHDIELPELIPGDILAVFSTGAYNYSMASNYNRLPRPAMVLVADGAADIIVARESYQDLLRNDRIPERLMQGAVANSARKE